MRHAIVVVLTGISALDAAIRTAFKQADLPVKPKFFPNKEAIPPDFANRHELVSTFTPGPTPGRPGELGYEMRRSDDAYKGYGISFPRKDCPAERIAEITEGLVESTAQTLRMGHI